MTTIIVDRKEMIMAADRQSLMGGTFKFRSYDKIKRLANADSEWLVASAGCAEAGLFFERWFDEYLRRATSSEDTFPELEHVYPKEGEFAGLALSSTGTLYLYLSKGCGIEIADRYFAVGSGGDISLGAVYAGASLPDAVRIASKLDAGTGRGVQVESFATRRSIKKKVSSK